MQIVIDIPKELYAKVPTLVNKGSMWIGDVLEAVKNGIPLETQPTECKFCDKYQAGYADGWAEAVRGDAE